MLYRLFNQTTQQYADELAADSLEAAEMLAEYWNAHSNDEFVVHVMNGRLGMPVLSAPLKPPVSS